MISGYVCTRNGTTLDYCWELAVESLIPVCEELVISVGTSTDDTRERAAAWEQRDSRVRVIDYDWGNPVGDIHWWTRWLNVTREQLKFPMQLTLDGDEVLDPGSYAAVRQAAGKQECRWFHRLNFWQDTRHMAPHGRVCGEQVVRLAPTNLWMPSDEPHPEGEPEVRVRAGWPPNASSEFRIFHYGFLRKESAFLGKIRTVNGAFFGSSDDRVERAAEKGVPWISECPFDLPMLVYNGSHPQIAHQWLRDRGYQL